MIVYHLCDEVAITIGDFYNFKEGSQDLPTRYVGADTEKIHTQDGRQIRATSSSSYINNSIETVEVLLLEDGKYEVLKSN